MAHKVEFGVPFIAPVDHLGGGSAIAKFNLLNFSFSSILSEYLLLHGMCTDHKLTIRRPAASEHMSCAGTLLERLLNALLQAPIQCAPNF